MIKDLSMRVTVGQKASGNIVVTRDLMQDGMSIGKTRSVIMNPENYQLTGDDLRSAHKTMAVLIRHRLMQMSLFPY